MSYLIKDFALPCSGNKKDIDSIEAHLKISSNELFLLYILNKNHKDTLVILILFFSFDRKELTHGDNNVQHKQ